MSKWVCTVIQGSNKKYYANMMVDGRNIYDLPEYVDYKTLKEAIEKRTGVLILKRKDMIFEKLSNTEKIATIDNTQYRGEGKDCRVTIAERINGWSPCWD